MRRAYAMRASLMAPFKLTNPGMSEATLHRSVAHMLDWLLLPPAFYTTFPAGWGVLPRATAGQLQACGMKSGMPDILLFDVGRVIGIELKVGANKATSSQVKMAEKLKAVGIEVHICRSLDDVLDILSQRAVATRPHWMGDREIHKQ